MGNEMDLKDTYNKIAEDWHKDHRIDDWWYEGVDKFVSFLKPGDLVLDVGCATGFKSKYLVNKGLRVVGIDISEKLLEIAKKEVPKAKFYLTDMCELNNLKEKFDGIFAQASLLHIPKKEVRQVIKNISTKLKTGGYFYIAVKEKKEAEEEVKVEDDYGYKYERFFSYFTLDEIRSYLKKFDINIVFETITGSGKTNWIQVIGKK